MVEHDNFCKQLLHFQPGQVGIVANGRIIGPFDEDEEFVTADYLLLERHALKSSVSKIYEAIKGQIGKTISSFLRKKKKTILQYLDRFN